MIAKILNRRRNHQDIMHSILTLFYMWLIILVIPSYVYLLPSNVVTADTSEESLSSSRNHIQTIARITVLELNTLSNFIDAHKYFYKDLSSNANDLFAVVDKGDALYRSSNFTGAIQYYDKALAIQRNYVKELYNGGLILDDLGNHTQAIQYYDKALAINSTIGNVLTKKALALFDLNHSKHVIDVPLILKGLQLDILGNYTGAIAYYDKALAMDPTYVVAIIGKAVALNSLENYTGAIAYLDKALATNPNSMVKAFAFRGIGLTLDRLENYTGAIAYFDKSLAINPTDPVTLNGKALALSGLGKYSLAIVFYDKALKINPSYVSALNNKGLALYGLGNYTAAIAYYDKALKINHNYVNAYNNRGNALFKLGRYDEALANYKYESDFGSNITRMSIHSYGDYEQNFRIFEVANVISIQESQFRYDEATLTNTGIVKVTQTLYDAAIEIFTSVLSKDQKYYYALWNMGDAYYKEGNHTQAKIYYEESLAINHNYTGGLVPLPDIPPIGGTPKEIIIMTCDTFIRPCSTASTS